MLSEGEKSRAAQYIEENIRRSAFSHAEIAALLGYNTSAVIYGFINGEIKVPLDKVAPLAAALRVDAAQLFMLVVQDWFSPALLEQIYENMLALPPMEPELAWIRVLRTIFGGELPQMTDEIRSRLETSLATVERRRRKKFD